MIPVAAAVNKSFSFKMTGGRICCVGSSMLPGYLVCRGPTGTRYIPWCSLIAPCTICCFAAAVVVVVDDTAVLLCCLRRCCLL